VRLESSASAVELARLKAIVDQHCPVLDILQAPVPVSLTLEAPGKSAAAD
jgi:hypothetical protein